MADVEDTRELPKTWADYLKDSAQTVKVMRWAYEELTLAESRKWIVRFLVMLGFTTALQLGQPWLISFIFDGLIGHNMNLIWWGLGGTLVFSLAQKWGHWYECRARDWVIGLNMGSIDHLITVKLFEKSLGQFVQEGSALHVSNIDKGRWRVQELLAMLLFDGVPIVFALLVAYLFLWFLSPLTAVVMTIVIVIHTLWSLHLNQKTVAVGFGIDKDWRHLNRYRVERWEKIERVKTSGAEKDEVKKMDQWWDSILTVDRKFWLWFISQTTLRGLVNVMGLLLVMAYGCWQVWSGAWPIGRLYPLFSWASLLCFNLWQVSRIEHMLNWNMPSIKSMMAAITIKPDITFKDSPIQINRDEPLRLEFSNLSYTYPTGGSEDNQEEEKPAAPVIQNISFNIEPGEKVALIGSSGAGKSTLMRLVLRYMDPDEGEIRINGNNLQDVDLSSWMRLVGYIPQQSQILDGTIRYNLLYGLEVREREAITDEEIWEMMRTLQIDFGKRLTDGLETKVGLNGMKLSGGQAQRLMIGAAAIKKPLIMLIDEATSSLDSTTEKAVQAGLENILAQNVSALVIAHRLSTVRYLCDRFIVIREIGTTEENVCQVEAIGESFEELYSISPTFRRLADDQDIAIDAVFDADTTRYRGHAVA